MEEIAGLMRAKGFGVTAVNCYGLVAIFHHGYSRQVAGVIQFCHRYHYSFYPSYSKLMNGPSVKGLTAGHNGVDPDVNLCKHSQSSCGSLILYRTAVMHAPSY